MSDLPDKAQFTTHRPQPDDALEFESYRYPPPHDIYDSAPGSADHFLDPDNQYFSVRSSDGALWGFACLGAEAQVPGGRYDDDDGILDLGVGMSPARMGRGHGHAFCSAVIDLGASAGATRFRVTVAAFNTRSLHVWKSLGFAENRRFIHSKSGQLFIQLQQFAA